MTQNDQAAMNEQLTQLRLQGLSIDGDNRYKQDLIDAIIGAMMFGAQGANPPPTGHWLEQFYVIGREEREARAALATQPAAGEQRTSLWGCKSRVGNWIEDYTDDPDLAQTWRDCDFEVVGFCEESKRGSALNNAAPPAAAHGDEAAACRHRLADARNKHIASGYFCVDCGAAFAAADHAAMRAQAGEGGE